MTKPLASWIKVLVIFLMGCAIGCVVLISIRPSGRISVLHQYWSQARVDEAATGAAIEAARKEPRVSIASGKYITVDRIDLGDRSLKSRFDLYLSDTGTFTAARTTSIARDREDIVTIEGSYEVAGRAITFNPQQGPIGLYPVDGSSVITVRDDGTMALAAGDKAIELRRAGP